MKVMFVLFSNLPVLTISKTASDFWPEAAQPSSCLKYANKGCTRSCRKRTQTKALCFKSLVDLRCSVTASPSLLDQLQSLLDRHRPETEIEILEVRRWQVSSQAADSKLSSIASPLATFRVLHRLVMS